MRVLPKPALSPAEVLTSCIAGVEDVDLVSRLEDNYDSILITAADYAAQASNTSLQIVQKDATVGTLTRSELESLYIEQMSKAEGAARYAYSALLNSAPNRKCPLCGVGYVTTLDHHLPKSRYPLLSVVPLNLVPCCFDCNKAKGIRIPRTIDRQTFHPYFDDFTQVLWLAADPAPGPPVTITFTANPPAHLSDLDQARVKHHFSALKLAERYTSNANDELSGRKEAFRDVFLVDGQDGLREFLTDQAILSRPRLNSWQHATYRALASCAWFCAGGYDAIPDPA